MNTIEQDRETLLCLELNQKASGLMSKFYFFEAAATLKEALKYSAHTSQEFKSFLCLRLAESQFKSGDTDKAIHTLETYMGKFDDDLIENNLKFLHAAIHMSGGDYLTWYKVIYDINIASIKPLKVSNNLWNGEDDISGKSILLTYQHCGIGDAIAFFRFAKLLADKGARPTVEVNTPLKNIEIDGVRILDRSADQVEFLNQFDYSAPQLSLPNILQIERQNLPTDVYIKPSQYYFNKWHKKLGLSNRFRVGICWSSVSVNGIRERFMDLNQLNELLNLDIEFYSLQIEYSKDDQAAINQGTVIDCSNEIKCMHDTAGLIGQMDLILSVDTAVAHLAGAMGKPLWMMLPRYRVLYWDVEQSYWYPHAKLFRQSRSGDWAEVIERVKAELLS